MTIVGGRKMRRVLARAGNLLVIVRRRIEPQGSPAGLERVSDRNDLLGVDLPMRHSGVR